MTNLIRCIFLLLFVSSCDQRSVKSENNFDLPPANIFLVINKEGKFAKGILSDKNAPLRKNLNLYTLINNKKQIINFDFNRMINNPNDSIFDININQQNMTSFVNKGITNIYFEKLNKETDTISIDINNNNGKNKLYYIKTISYNGDRIPLLKDVLGDNIFAYYLK